MYPSERSQATVTDTSVFGLESVPGVSSAGITGAGALAAGHDRALAGRPDPLTVRFGVTYDRVGQTTVARPSWIDQATATDLRESAHSRSRSRVGSSLETDAS